jgi:hypothetical protein
LLAAKKRLLLKPLPLLLLLRLLLLQLHLLLTLLLLLQLLHLLLKPTRSNFFLLDSGHVKAAFGRLFFRLLR